MGEGRTIDDLSLRELTEAAVAWFEASPGSPDYGVWSRYVDETMPPKILALLDRLETAEAAVERVRAMLAAWDAWDGSPGPDGRTHPDSSSPRDRERLREALEGRESHVEAPGSAGRTEVDFECHREGSGRENGAEDFTPPPAAYWSEGKPMPGVGRWHQHKSEGGA